ncbi:uncharacterized protein [Littorina saxatilis]|uniref:Protein quiver n=1 Tax=Littorina saxatilis TaxID=31220 RepID=A0AAN9B6H8_9CAEN
MEKLLMLMCLLFATLLGFVECLDCHECAAISADDCLDPYSGPAMADDYMSTCDDGSHCVKYKTVIKLRDSGYIMGWERDSIVVTRACQPANDLPTGCVHWQGAGGFTIKCRCDSDGCNSARLLRPSFWTAVMSLVALVFMLR